ncbi:MAG: MBL fold metallo-hydrolase [Lachnospiraceae bacterium]|nr:MBL fold metallo-hydrolase [Lachnospiraceae bacterium]
MGTLRVIKYYYQAFFSHGGLGMLFVLALVWLLAGRGRKKRGNDDRRLLIPAVIIAIVTVCPLSAWVIIRAIGEDVYWRVFWMLPLAAVIPYALTEITDEIGARTGGRTGSLIRRALTVVCFAALIALNGNLVTGSAFFTERTNDYKLPQRVVDVIDIINEHAALHDIRSKRIIAPEEIAVYARLYDASIRQNYGRGTLKNESIQRDMYRLINEENPDYAVLIKKLRHNHYRYAVIRKAADDRQAMENAKFECLGEITSDMGGYVIYFNSRWYGMAERKEAMEDGEIPEEETEEETAEARETGRTSEASATDAWTVTQYGPRDVNSMFYTIHHPEKGLIVVDGGWTEDAQYVRGVIENLGGIVDAWILTHQHEDHCGAFNAIWPDPGTLQIRAVYTVEMASPSECLEAAPWDSTDCLSDFLALDIPVLHYVHRGDELTICSLPFQVLNAFDDEVRTLSKDYLNDGSMMFRVKGPERTMLFCGDVGKSMSAFIYRQYKQVLPSDYVQMGHHGNGGLNPGFYKKTAPEAAFFDAPDWLMNDPEGKYNTPAKITLMESLGSRILSFSSAPNAVQL